ncbi:MAG: hypothetical protein Fur0034_00400 [Desulfuromonadia bacterium]
MQLRYETVREKLIIREETAYLRRGGAALCGGVVAATGTWYLLSRGETLPALLCSILVLLSLASLAHSLSSLFAVRAERPASRESIETLMALVNRSPFKEELREEIRRLLEEQGELYQYQVYALILRARV